jgi:GntR family transcriptional regulator
VNIDPRSHIPIYLQIADGIREAVAAGVYLPGEAIPSLKAMSLKAKVNPNTVQRAYDELAREGVIYSQRGRGLFVAEQGKASARTIAQQSLQRTLQDGIRAARAAGVSLREIRKVFTAAIVDSSKK